MRLGFPHPCFWISTSPAYCNSRRVFTAFCRPQWSRSTTSQIKGTVGPAFQRRQVFIGVISHAFPPFCFPLPFSPKRLPAPFLRRVPALARSPYFGTFCPEVRLLAVLPQPGYSFSDGHSVFKVLSIDELP